MGRTWSRPRRVAVVLGFYASLAVLWETLVRLGVMPNQFFPTIPEVIESAGQHILQASYWEAVGVTLFAWAVAVVVSCVLGTALGLLLGAYAPALRLANGTIEFLRPLPPVALIPLVVVLFGLRQDGAIFLAVFGAIWPVLVQAVYGARSVDSVLSDSAAAIGLGRWQRVFILLVPSAAPSVMTGLRLATSINLILVITAGIVIGTPGLGAELTEASKAASYASTYVLIITMGLIGVLLNVLAARLQDKVLFWLPSKKAEAI